MIFSKKLKSSLLTLSMISFTQIPSIAYSQYFTTSESSMLTSSLIVSAVSAMPIVLPIESSKGMSFASKNSSEEEEDQFVYLDAKDEAGNPIQLKLPKEMEDRVQITADDKIKLEDGKKGDRILYINGKAKHLFIKQNDANILQHKAL